MPRKGAKAAVEKVPGADGVIAGEHIFPATPLTRLAIRWKELNEANRHREAMVILEDIIKDSTPMFERLAQHEDYDYTVDLKILVAAAQEKVVRWLLHWNPEKGRLFTFFSKCLSGDTPILCANNTYRLIREIVDKKLAVDVVSWDGTTWVERPVVDWHRNPVSKEEWRVLTVEVAAGIQRKIMATRDHLFLTQRGWVQLEDITPLDRVHTDGSYVKETLSVVTCNVPVSGPTVSYCLEVKDTHNFLANGCVVKNCAKNAFRSEVVKVNQYRRRFHVTDENPERLFGFHDPTLDKHAGVEIVHRNMNEIVARWGSPQELGAIRYILACMEDIQDGTHDRQAVIKGAMFAYGLSQELSKFFYQWALIALRDAMYKHVVPRFTEQDLFHAQFSYTLLPDLLNNLLSWEQMKKFILLYGGSRLKVPTMSQIEKLKESYVIFEAINETDLSPTAIAKVAKHHGKTDKTAEEIFRDMTEAVNPNRTGEYPLYEQLNDHDRE